MIEWGRIKSLGDSQLTRSLKESSLFERAALVDFLMRLSEFDERRLYLKKTSSLIRYCIEELKYAEGAAAKRAFAARAIRRFPVLLQRLKEGRVTLTAIYRIAPHLNEANYLGCLRAIENKTIREVERFIVSIAPRPDSADRISPIALKRAALGFAERPDESGPPRRPFPPFPHPPGPSAPAHAASGVAAPADRRLDHIAPPPEDVVRPPRVEPLAPGRVRVNFSADDAFALKLKRAKDLLWHKFPNGRLEDVLGEALEALLERKDPLRRAARRKRRLEARLARKSPGASGMGRGDAGGDGAPAPRPDNPRRIPPAVRDAVWERDEGRCAYRAPGGGRCDAETGVEVDHITPWSCGGRSDDPDNLRLLCRAHNQGRARERFGPPPAPDPPPGRAPRRDGA